MGFGLRAQATAANVMTTPSEPTFEPGDTVECFLCQVPFIVSEDMPFARPICPSCISRQQGCGCG
jgi:hypothetical protein